jgi:hypothetical protein
MPLLSKRKLERGPSKSTISGWVTKYLRTLSQIQVVQALTSDEAKVMSLAKDTTTKFGQKLASFWYALRAHALYFHVITD